VQIPISYQLLSGWQSVPRGKCIQLHFFATKLLFKIMIIDISNERYGGRTEWRYEYGVLQTSNYDQKQKHLSREAYTNLPTNHPQYIQ
jgi:hypothetical protein